ncbi:uncharacterized protein LOC124272236 [Haliotis rubra]|uniref:uncharacterized protein LOC124272236 n=1 Tax=Haliotis rubra TaxID=36100 RepID=UPI001EE542F9|nr:uncharacterized protein LOC124272236 [Haliotis rubra]
MHYLGSPIFPTSVGRRGGQRRNFHIAVPVASSCPGNKGTKDRITVLIPAACQVVELEGKDYYVSTSKLNWKDASDSCRAMGAKLAEPKTEKENNLIQGYLVVHADCESYYFGLSSSDGQTFLFQDDPLTYYGGWGSGQPRQLNSAVAYAKYQCSTYTWSVNDGTARIRYICEMLDPTTTTSTTTTPTPTSAPTATRSTMDDTTPLVNASNNGTLQNVSTTSQSAINWKSGACPLVFKAVSLTTLTTLLCIVFGLEAHF